MAESKKNISMTTGILMVGTAIFFDIFQAFLNIIPFVGQVMAFLLATVPATFFFWLWFKIEGIPFTKGRKVALGGGILIESLPVINALPGWTAAIVVCLLTDKVTKVVTTTLKEKAAKNAPSPKS